MNNKNTSKKKVKYVQGEIILRKLSGGIPWGKIFRGLGWGGRGVLSRGKLLRGNCSRELFRGNCLGGKERGVIVLGEFHRGSCPCGGFHGGQLSGEQLSRG